MDLIYLIELEIRDTRDTTRSASYVGIHLEVDSDGRLRTTLYDKTDNLFNLPIMNFPFMCCNIPAAPPYGIYPSQCMQCYRACGTYQEFLEKGS